MTFQPVHPPEVRAAVRQLRAQRLRYTDIAARLGLTYGQVAGLIYRDGLCEPGRPAWNICDGSYTRARRGTA